MVSLRDHFKGVGFSPTFGDQVGSQNFHHVVTSVRLQGARRRGVLRDFRWANFHIFSIDSRVVILDEFFELYNYGDVPERQLECRSG